MSSEKTTSDALYGKELIKAINASIPNKSGIYKMLDSSSKILYIGKAKNLKNRIYSYAAKALSPRIEHMIAQIKNIDWIITKSELDALILESTLIKQQQPKYNILLKDDKTFPFIKLDLEHNFPRVSKFRAKQGTPKKDMFGPYNSGFDIKEYIKLIQQQFQVRTCSDSYFQNRVQPCILYQIKRCSAPCVGKISKEDYQTSIKHLIHFLNGKNNALKNELTTKMNEASEQNSFEQAIVYRERLKFLSSLANKQAILINNNRNTDFISLLENADSLLFNVFTFRNGYNYGSNAFSFKNSIEKDLFAAMEEFVLQYYENRNLPENIIINIPIASNKEEVSLLEQALHQKHNKKIKIQNPADQNIKQIMDVVIENAFNTLEKQQKENIKWLANFKDLEKYFNLSKPINKIEVYDNSHLYGTLSLGVLICAEVSGFNKNAYKIFNQKNIFIKGNDDYGILREVLNRRFSKLKEKNEEIPDLVFIDGGKGQLAVAIDVIRNLGFLEIKIVGIAKGKNRNAGEETLFIDNGEQLNPDTTSSTLHFIQMLRNEAHRFAIDSLRKRKLKTIITSELDNISGIGNIRKKILLKHFGSVENIKKATLEELMAVKGIDKKTSITIFNYFN